MYYIRFSKICNVLSLAILSAWCSGELHLNHLVCLTYLIFYPVFPDSELPSIFCAVFRLLYDFVWLNRPPIRMLTSAELGATFWKRSFAPAYLQVYPAACSFSIQCDYFGNGIYTVYITLLSPLDFLSLKKSLEVVPSFFSLSLWEFCHLSVYPCWYLNKKGLSRLKSHGPRYPLIVFLPLAIASSSCDFFSPLQYLHGYLKG